MRQITQYRGRNYKKKISLSTAYIIVLKYRISLFSIGNVNFKPISTT